METLLENIGLQRFGPLLKAQNMEIDTLKTSLQNQMMISTIQSFLATEGMTIGDFAKLTSAILEHDKVRERSKNRPASVTPPQTGKFSASRRAQLLGTQNAN